MVKFICPGCKIQFFNAREKVQIIGVTPSGFTIRGVCEECGKVVWKKAGSLELFGEEENGD